MSGRFAARLVLVVAVLGTIGCDRVTKHVATTTLSGMPGQSYLADTVRLGYAENSGGFLSLGATLPPSARMVIFTVGTGLMLLTLTVLAVRRGSSGWPALGHAVLVAGGASNWIDRVMSGSVVDFLNVGIGPVRTGVFNVADVAIMFGAIVFVVGEFRKGRHRPSISNGSNGTA
jgi:signal peptidase II